MVKEDFLEEKGSSEALKAAECDIEEGKSGMFGEVVTVWDWVEEGSGWDYCGKPFDPLESRSFRSDTVFQVEVGGHHVFGLLRMPGEEAVGSWRK